MTYTNDPNRTDPPRTNPPRPRDSNTSMWLVAILAVIVAIGGIVYATSTNTPTASNTPATTTGSGTTSPRTTVPVQPTNPAGNIPTAPAPAPASPNR